MAERRMFAKKITESDAFLDMPTGAQCLYLHLGMAADDDGVVNAPNAIRRACGATAGEQQLLVDKGFLIAFDSGVVVIKHWRINNAIQKDRYRASAYTEEMGQLAVKPNGAYSRRCIQNVSNLDTDCIQDASTLETQVRLGKDRLGKDRIGEGEGTTRKRFVPPTLDEVAAFVQEIGGKIDPQRFLDYYASNGWMVGRNHMKDWKATVRRWAREDGKTGKAPATTPKPSALTAQDYTQRQYAGDVINLFEDEEDGT